MNNKQKGFTLAELMVAVAIIAILAAIAVPNIIGTTLPRSRLRSSARDLHSDLLKARSIGLKQNRSILVEFNINGNSYTIDGGRPIQLKSGITFGFGHARRSATQPPGNLPSHPVTFAGNKITFNTRGLSNAGYIYLKNNNDEAYSVGVRSSGSIVLKQWVAAKNSWQ